MSDGFFVAELPDELVVGESVALRGAESHHAVTVRRIRLGEVVTVTDQAGRGVRGPALNLAKDLLEVRIDEVLLDTPSRPRITVVQALIKDRAEQALDLLTEVGADRIIPWQAGRSLPRWEEPAGDKYHRWQGWIRAAAKQSRRLRAPRLDPLCTTRQVAQLLAEAAYPLVMHETATRPLSEVADLAVADEIVVVIGPEGGIAPAELAEFEAAGATCWSLGPTVLRAATAGAVAVCQLRLLAGLVAGEP